MNPKVKKEVGELDICLYTTLLAELSLHLSLLDGNVEVLKPLSRYRC